MYNRVPTKFIYIYIYIQYTICLTIINKIVHYILLSQCLFMQRGFQANTQSVDVQ